MLPTGVAEAGAWRYAFIYDIVSRWIPDQTTAARDLSRSEARATILNCHLRNVIYATPKEVARLFGWTAKETTIMGTSNTIFCGLYKAAGGYVRLLSHTLVRLNMHQAGTGSQNDSRYAIGLKSNRSRPK